MSPESALNLSPNLSPLGRRPVDNSNNKVTGDRLGDRSNTQPVTQLNRSNKPFLYQKVTGDRFKEKLTHSYEKTALISRKTDTECNSSEPTQNNLSPVTHAPNSGQVRHA